MTRDEHYTDGRRWSHISKAWILLSSWNDREELATMTAAAESVRLENVRQRALIEQQAKELEQLKDLNEHLKIEAQGHAQEARTANATIYEIYQCVRGSTGEVGNWHGAQPVRDAMDKQAKELAQLKINHAEINVEFDRLNSVITRQMEEIERLRDKLERISRHAPIMGSTGDYRQGQLDVLESVKRIAEEHP